MKKTLLSLVVLTALVAFGATQAEAAISDSATINVTVTLTAETLEVSVDSVESVSWTITNLALSGTAQSPTYVVKNETAHTPETLSIECSTGTNWTIVDAAGAPGSDKFAMTAVGGDLGTATSIHTGQQLDDSLAGGGTINDLVLTFIGPTAAGSYTTDSMTVTLTAS